MNQPIVDIVHFSDVLCVWAYIAQVRVDELQQNYVEKIHVDYRFLQVFGDVAGKMATQWADRGGLAGYAAHVQEVAAQFEHITISPQAWLANTPTSSLPAHLTLCAVRAMRAADPAEVPAGQVEKLLCELRRAFFVDLVDISNQQKVLELAERVGVSLSGLQSALGSGAAHAQFAADTAAATQSIVRASPTLMFNEGRQVLAGNVGYRVLEANVRELLRSPGQQLSWC